ncbi:hypothetical protein J6590_088678 [Homalodisca vitripennis]|nr:hypothetical protein J6590_088678 [Homalodisca vitripennis]
MRLHSSTDHLRLTRGTSQWQSRVAAVLVGGGELAYHKYCSGDSLLLPFLSGCIRGLPLVVEGRVRSCSCIYEQRGRKQAENPKARQMDDFGGDEEKQGGGNFFEKLPNNMKETVVNVVQQGGKRKKVIVRLF